MPHLPPQRQIIVHKEEPQLPPPPTIDTMHPVTARFEVKRIMMTTEFQNTLPDNLKERVKSIFSGCGCHTSDKIDAIMPEIRGYLDAAFAPKT